MHRTDDHATLCRAIYATFTAADFYTNSKLYVDLGASFPPTGPKGTAKRKITLLGMYVDSRIFVRTPSPAQEDSSTR